MAESLSAEQLEERRTNLYAFRHVLGMVDASELTTTLRIQEEWLATVDELQEFVEDVAQDAYILRGLRTRKCLLSDMLGGDACTDYWERTDLYCASCYLRAIHKPEGETPPLRSLGLTPEEATELVSDGPQPLPPIAPQCPTCGELKSSFVDGDCPQCNPVTCETTGQAHVWVKVGTVGLTDKSLSAMDWGDTKCLRCSIPEPEEE